MHLPRPSHRTRAGTQEREFLEPRPYYQRTPPRCDARLGAAQAFLPDAREKPALLGAPKEKRASARPATAALHRYYLAVKAQLARGGTRHSGRTLPADAAKWPRRSSSTFQSPPDYSETEAYLRGYALDSPCRDCESDRSGLGINYASNRCR